MSKPRGKYWKRAMIMRPLYTLSDLTFRERKDSSTYEKLAKNGYIYKWAVPLLKKYKAIDSK